MLTQPGAHHRAAIAATLAKDRLRRFRAVFGGDTASALTLYHQDLCLAAALHSMLAVTEVCVREAMHRQLSMLLGADWYLNAQGHFDERTAQGLASAVRAAGHRAPPGKVVAEITLGTWTGLLGPGGWSSVDGVRRRLNYEETLWVPALRSAFPHSSGVRVDVAELATRVRYARNRVAHYEPVVFGVPLPGRGPKGGQVRRAPAGVLEDIRVLCATVNPDVADWLRSSTIADDLAAGPHVRRALDHMASWVTYR